MKRLIFYSLTLLALAACSKSSKVKPAINLTGTYVSYKEIDTLYNDLNPLDGVETITVYVGPGDSVYNYPGTVYANSGYTNTPSNNPAPAGRDSITFNSSSTATVIRPPLIPTYITYDLKAGTFSDGLPNMRERIVVIDANTVELIANQVWVNSQPNTTGVVIATYYRKK